MPDLIDLVDQMVTFLRGEARKLRSADEGLKCSHTSAKALHRCQMCGILLRPRFVSVGQVGSYKCDFYESGSYAVLYIEEELKKSGSIQPKSLFSVRLHFGSIEYRARHPRLMRQAFRIGSDSSRFKTLCLNDRTAPSLIREQLAIFFAQAGTIDSSVLTYLGLTGTLNDRRSEVRRWMSVQLIERFADPEHPGSFAALKKHLRSRASTELALGNGVKASRQLTKNHDRNGRQRVNVKLTELHELTVDAAAQMHGISRRTLYQYIRDEKIKSMRDEHGRLRVFSEDVAHLAESSRIRSKNNDLRSLLIDRYSAVRNVSTVPGS